MGGLLPIVQHSDGACILLRAERDLRVIYHIRAVDEVGYSSKVAVFTSNIETPTDWEDRVLMDGIGRPSSSASVGSAARWTSRAAGRELVKKGNFLGLCGMAG